LVQAKARKRRTVFVAAASRRAAAFCWVAIGVGLLASERRVRDAGTVSGSGHQKVSVGQCGSTTKLKFQSLAATSEVPNLCFF
jgi:hypothetical protein